MDTKLITLLRRQLSSANNVIKALHNSGCLDAKHEGMTREYLCKPMAFETKESNK